MSSLPWRRDLARLAIDTNHNMHIDEAEIIECVKNLGLDLDGKKLYSYLVGPNRKGLTLQEWGGSVCPQVMGSHLCGRPMRIYSTQWRHDQLSCERAISHIFKHVREFPDAEGFPELQRFPMFFAGEIRERHSDIRLGAPYLQDQMFVDIRERRPHFATICASGAHIRTTLLRGPTIVATP